MSFDDYLIIVTSHEKITKPMIRIVSKSESEHVHSIPRLALIRIATKTAQGFYSNPSNHLSYHIIKIWE